MYICKISLIPLCSFIYSDIKSIFPLILSDKILYHLSKKKKKTEKNISFTRTTNVNPKLFSLIYHYTIFIEASCLFKHLEQVF